MGRKAFHPTARAAAAAMLALVGAAGAAFLNGFGDVTHRAPLHLRWDAVDAGLYPLTLTARLINRTEGSRANGAVLNLTSTSFALSGFSA